IERENGHVIVSVPNIYTKRWLEEKCRAEIIETLTRMDSGVRSVEYRVVARAASAPAKDAFAATRPVVALGTHTTASAGPEASRGSQPERRNPSPHLFNPRYTFDNYVVGSSNELAYAACQAVAKYPGEKYSTLFIYGGVGLGKTHLMQAVGNEIMRGDPAKRIRYVTSEQFTNEFLHSIQTKKTRTFADLYRNLDVLIVDDIQFLGNKEKTQEEFFHTFNTLHQANKQIIMSSDKPPKDIPHLEDRLRSRFEMGMAADIQRPDLETRAAIVQRKALAQGTNLSFEIVEFLARQFQHNIRELEGALTQLMAYCEVRGIAPSILVAQELTGSHTDSQRRKQITPRVIIEKTAAFFDLLPADITGTKRDRDIVVPRQISMYLMREELDLSFPKIAFTVGRRDHTTAMHSVTKIEKLIEVDDKLRQEINQIKEQIGR
ncbi:MAG TPA: chromosomal replication initiator protein DnaA, partial [Candidatus Polarisedimenticolaceae bacterium]|nr:chromosomal replication initiator protein DnaA [Candidatus Polarisedimenticolaceae bacterium]